MEIPLRRRSEVLERIARRPSELGFSDEKGVRKGGCPKIAFKRCRKFFEIEEMSFSSFVVEIGFRLENFRFFICGSNSGVLKQSFLELVHFTTLGKQKLNLNFKLLVVFTGLLLFDPHSSLGLDSGSWNVMGLKYNLNNRWTLFAEGQLRSLKFYRHFHYYEYKGGCSFKPHNNLTFSVGGGSYQTYKEGGNFVLPKNNNEIRLWPQLVLTQKIGWFKIEQRYRAEFRFTSNGFRNRFRYRCGISYEFGKGKKSFKPFQISASNEIFFTDNQPYFERNRMSLAFNHHVSANLSLQIGYVHQFDYKINDETGRDFLQLGIYIELFRASIQDKTADPDLKDN